MCRWAVRSGIVRRLAVILTIAACALPAVPAPAYAAGCGPSITSPMPDQPWPLRRLRPDLVWPLTTGSGIVVAVIDSGVSDNHPTLSGQVLQGQDLVSPGGSGTCDEVGHGTLVAGIIAGRQTSSSGFHGIAPGVKILPIRVLATRDRSFDEALPTRIATAIRLATDSGAKVINLSLTTVPVPALADAVSYALSHDVVVVAAAGNDGESGSNQQPEYPAAYDGVVAVAGVDEQGNHVSTSTAGDYVDIAAPGVQIVGPAPQGGGYALEAAGGTSFAAAYVSGVVALLRSYRHDLNGPAVVQRLLRTADRPADGWDREVGAGVVNPYWAVVSDAGDAKAPSRAGQVSLPTPAPDSSGPVRRAAIATAVVAVVLSGLLLAGRWVVSSGRRRGWRPGRPEPE